MYENIQKIKEEIRSTTNNVINYLCNFSNYIGEMTPKQKELLKTIQSIKEKTGSNDLRSTLTSMISSESFMSNILEFIETINNKYSTILVTEQADLTVLLEFLNDIHDMQKKKSVLVDSKDALPLLSFAIDPFLKLKHENKLLHVINEPELESIKQIYNDFDKLTYMLREACISTIMRMWHLRLKEKSAINWEVEIIQQIKNDKLELPILQKLHTLEVSEDRIEKGFEENEIMTQTAAYMHYLFDQLLKKYEGTRVRYLDQSLDTKFNFGFCLGGTRRWSTELNELPILLSKAAPSSQQPKTLNERSFDLETYIAQQQQGSQYSEKLNEHIVPEYFKTTEFPNSIFFSTGDKTLATCIVETALQAIHSQQNAPAIEIDMLSSPIDGINGHAIGLKFDGHNNVRFFDYNYGEFLFHSRTNFMQWFEEFFQLTYAEHFQYFSIVLLKPKTLLFQNPYAKALAKQGSDLELGELLNDKIIELVVAANSGATDVIEKIRSEVEHIFDVATKLSEGNQAKLLSYFMIQQFISEAYDTNATIRYIEDAIKISLHLQELNKTDPNWNIFLAFLYARLATMHLNNTKSLDNSLPQVTQALEYVREFQRSNTELHQRHDSLMQLYNLATSYSGIDSIRKFSISELQTLNANLLKLFSYSKLDDNQEELVKPFSKNDCWQTVTQYGVDRACATPYYPQIIIDNIHKISDIHGATTCNRLNALKLKARL